MKTLEEYLIDYISHTHIYEIAKSQDKCKDVVRSECKNILINLTLINYFGISELYTTNIEHWKDELETAINNASDFTVKKDKSVSRRRRIVDAVFEEEDMYKYDRIFHRVYRKFEKEKEAQYPDNPLSAEWLDAAIKLTIDQLGVVKMMISEYDNHLIIKKFLKTL